MRTDESHARTSGTRPPATFATEPALRRATDADVGAIAELCRASFPVSLRWQGPRWAARAWWRAVLATPVAETWVACEPGGDEVLGFVLLVTDVPAWSRASRGAYPTAARFLGTLGRPDLVLRQVRRKRARTATDPARGADSVPADPRELVWNEIIAVSPRARGARLGARLQEQCEERAAALAKSVVRMKVDPNNDPMRRMCERLGYRVSASNAAGLTYSKRLGV